jgi:hypothetical protein
VKNKLPALRAFALAVVTQILALGMPAAALSGCAGAQAAAVVLKPVMPSARNDERFGRCYSGGVQIAGQVEATVHVCARFLDGGVLAPADAGSAQ